MMQRSSSRTPATSATYSVLPHVWRGTFWLAIKSPLQVIIAFWSVPLVQHALGADANGAYVFAWGFGFVQFLLEFGMGSALQRQMSHAWTSGDHDALNRLTACGLTFYAAVSVFQMSILLVVAYLGLPPQFHGQSRRLIVGLLWIQAVSAPFFGLLTVASSVLLAARRYDFLPRLDPPLMILRFAILILGLRAKIDFLAIVAVQTVVLLGGMLLPALWVIVRELGSLPHFAQVRASDYTALLRVGFYIFLMQLSVVLADKVDTTILGYALPDVDPGPSITVYQNVSKPFFQIRQTGWTLAYLVIPAVASLAATRDVRGLDQLKYDGTRFLVGLLLPVTLLAGIYSAPFLSLWVGPRYVANSPLLRLFLVATLPLVLSVHAQMAVGLGKMEVVAWSPLLGSLVNVPLSYYLTTRLGVAGVIWGTVLTTLVTNLLIPGVYLFRLLEIRLSTFLTRTLGPPTAGAAFLVAVAWVCSTIAPPEPSGTTLISRSSALVLNLSLSVVAYIFGYLAVARGRADLVAFVLELRQRYA
jgi:O-antigen/teichoic acid export membrane protein